MAVQVEVGTFTVDTAAANTTVTTDFQGKAVIIWNWGKTTEGESAGASFSIGFSDGTSNREISWAGDDAVATTNVGHNFSASAVNAVLTAGTPTSGTNGAITAVAFNAAPNMVVTHAGNPASAWKHGYILFGGDDITNIYVGTLTVPATTGSQSYTDAAFQPDAVFFFSGNATATGGAAVAYQNIGFAISSSKQWALTTRVSDAQTLSGSVNGMSKLISNGCLIGQTATNGDDYVADFTQFTATGFDLNWSDAAASAYLVYYLAIKGGHWDAGTAAKPATATAQTASGLSYVPKLLGLLMSSATSLATYTSNAVTTFGATDGTNQGYGSAFHNDAINTVASSSGSSAALSHEIGATADATYSSFGSDGSWAISWSATGTAFQTAWFTVGDTAAGGDQSTGFGDYAGEMKILRPAWW